MKGNMRVMKIKKLSNNFENFGVPGGTRTPGLELRRLAFYPAKLQAHINTLIL